MGIQGLAKMIGDHAPSAIKTQKFENYFGRKIAVDASMSMYQFLIVVGRQGDQMLTNEVGEITSHIQGMFYRTSRMLQAGIKPVYVFDGKPPKLKRDELDRRFVRRDDAKDDLTAAKEAGDQEAIEKHSKRTVKVTKQHADDCKKLLTLMGVPYIEAPSEAEAQCCAMCRADLVYGVATDDMDALTFGTPKLIRHLMAPGSNQKLTIDEFDMEAILQGMQLTQEQFIDMCILCGCDYCGTIRGIGPKRAYSLVQQHGCLEKVLDSLDKEKYPLPDPFPIEEVRALFKSPEVIAPQDIPSMQWKAPDLDGLIAWLVQEKQFSEERVRSAVDKINASRGKANQNRMESFFKVIPASKPAPQTTNKRKEPATKSKGPATKRLGKK